MKNTAANVIKKMMTEKESLMNFDPAKIRNTPNVISMIESFSETALMSTNEHPSLPLRVYV